MLTSNNSNSDPTDFTGGIDPQKQAAEKILGLLDFDPNKYVRDFLQCLQPYVPFPNLPGIVDSAERNTGALGDAIKLERAAYVQLALRGIDIAAEQAKDVIFRSEQLLSAPTPADLIASWAEVTKQSFQKTITQASEIRDDWTRRQHVVSNRLASRFIDFMREIKDQALSSRHGVAIT